MAPFCYLHEMINKLPRGMILLGRQSVRSAADVSFIPGPGFSPVADLSTLKLTVVALFDEADEAETFCAGVKYALGEEVFSSKREIVQSLAGPLHAVLLFDPGTERDGFQVMNHLRVSPRRSLEEFLAEMDLVATAKLPVQVAVVKTYGDTMVRTYRLNHESLIGQALMVTLGYKIERVTATVGEKPQEFVTPQEAVDGMEAEIAARITSVEAACI